MLKTPPLCGFSFCALQFLPKLRHYVAWETYSTVIQLDVNIYETPNSIILFWDAEP